MPCFYTPELNLTDDLIIISGSEFHHIIHVFRKKINDKITLSNGKGLLANCKITGISSKELTATIIKSMTLEASHPKIVVAFPLLKNKHDNVIIEKLTELGVKEFFPFTSLRTVRKPSNKTLVKFQKVAISALKQCDNAFLPEIHPVYPLFELIPRLQDFELFTAVEFGVHKNLLEIIKNQTGKQICIIIGPEGGFDEEEVTDLQKYQVSTFTLGNHILRAETAAIASVSLVVGYLLKEASDYY
ncbi:MAG: 16S rRNA (uracil(1498)-N(3))-methyltransferase [Candidatus Cloacimonetes bacterium]|nr:16S rRNA (uracil(1498)-N(3))-methyltransferase [Candidatus Cloacimonadota bacterium]